jgi:hypothetical protein
MRFSIASHAAGSEELLITAAVLFVGGLVLIVVVWRKTRWLLPVVGLFVGSAALAAIRMYAIERNAKRIDGRIAESCRGVASDLESDIERYRMLLSRTGVDYARRAQQMQITYLEMDGMRKRWVRMCVPNENWQSCLPSDLDLRTLDKIKRAASAIMERTACDTSDGK